MDDGWTDHSSEGPCLENYQKAGYTVFKGIGDKETRIITPKEREFARCGSTEVARAIVDSLVIVDELAKTKGKPKVRFTVVKQRQWNPRVLRHDVVDNQLQMEVFHWYGETGKAKCEAVAAALNALGHERD
jgi:hypothetical protein